MTAAVSIVSPSACEHVSVSFGHGLAAVRALEDITLELAACERVALLGPSGSGKTTLLHVLGGLVEPTSGRVLWHGEPLASLDRAARTGIRAGGLGYVFQGRSLLPHFTAVENIAFATLVAQTRLRDRLDPLALLELVGLADKADHLPAELSAGEAQRVAIARAIAQMPTVLLCDEPTGHLDSDTGARVLDLLDALQSEFSFTLVIATHNLVLAARLGRAVELVDGRIVRDEMT